MIKVRQTDLGFTTEMDNTTLGLPISKKRKSKNTVGMSFQDYYAYASTLVRLHLPHNIASPDELNEEFHDLTQSSVSELWLRLSSEQTKITFPKAYLASIVYSRCMDMLRHHKRKSTLPLPIDQDGELRLGRVLFVSSEGMQDPALEYEHKESIEEIIADVAKLPKQQRYAMICVLKDEVGPAFPLAETFGIHGIDIQSINWPQEPHELQKLRSSLSVARKTLLKKYRHLALEA